MKSFLVTTLALAVAAPAYAGETTFVIGSRPWNFSDRSRESHLTIQQRGPDWGKPSSSAGAIPSGAGYPGYPGYPVSSNSYSIGNWVQIDHACCGRRRGSDHAREPSGQHGRPTVRL